MPFEAHWLVDAVLGFTLLEAAGLALLHRFRGRGVAVAEFLPNMASGLALMLALRSVLTGGALTTMACWLVAAGALHGIDLWRRWR